MVTPSQELANVEINESLDPENVRGELESLSRSVEALCERGALWPIGQMEDSIAARFPMRRIVVDGVTGSGKTSLWNQLALVQSVSDAIWLNRTGREEMALPLVLEMVEPSPIPVEESVAGYFGLTGRHEGLTYRALCKGLLRDPLDQLMAFIIARNRLHYYQEEARKLFVRGAHLVNLEPFPGVSLSVSPAIAITMGIIPREFGPLSRSSREFHPVTAVSDRGDFSSLVFQGYQLAVRTGTRFEDAIGPIWEVHQKLVRKGYLHETDLYIVTFPHAVEPECPSFDAYVQPAEGGSYLDASGEPDMFEFIVTPEQEVYLYAQAINFLRQHSEAPDILALVNDPEGELRTLTYLSVLVSAVISGCTVEDYQGVLHPQLLQQLEKLHRSRAIAWFLDDSSLLRGASLQEGLAWLLRMQPEFEEGEGRYLQHCPRDWLNLSRD